MFDFRTYDALFLANPGQNDATAYGVTIERASGAEFKCIGVHHLTPFENKGRAFVFLAVRDEHGNRIPNARVGWTWEGRQPNRKVQPAILDKGEGEPPGHIGLTDGMVVNVWVEGTHSDIVWGLRCDHAEDSPHSFYVVFQRMANEPMPPPDPPVVDGALEARITVLEAELGWMMKVLRRAGETLREL